MNARYFVPFLFLASVAGSGCAERLVPEGAPTAEEDADPPGKAQDSFPGQSGQFTHTVGRDGVITTVVDATDASAWQTLDLDSGHSVDDDWDLGFSRFRVKSNGGVSGAGGVQAAPLDGEAFADVGEPPEQGWLFDRRAEASDDDDAQFTSALVNAFHRQGNEWYAYDGSTHTLTPQDVTFVVASTEGRFYKLRFDSYYDEVGTPAVVSFRWAEIDGLDHELPPIDVEPEPEPERPKEPEPPEIALTLDASSASSWVHLKVGSGVVEVASPESSLGWDLAIRRTEMRSNGGTSGPGVGGVRLEPSGAPFEELTASPTFGFEVDVLRNSGVPGAMDTSQNAVLAEWYDYDGATHRVTPGNRTYLVRTAVGGYAKLHIWSWLDGVYELSLLPLDREVSVETLELDASGPGWRGVSLAAGEALDEEVDFESLGWDFAFSGRRVRTNSGTSGPGDGGAAELVASSLDEVSGFPAEGWVADTLIEDDGGEAIGSGNSVLAAWSEDPDAEQPTPRPIAYGIRTAQGDLGAFRIVSYEDGRYVLEIAYAGPGRTSL